jgi:hypothetical protein
MTGFKSKREMAKEDDDIQDYKRPWVGLTDDEIDSVFQISAYQTEKRFSPERFAQAIEQALKEKNT